MLIVNDEQYFIEVLQFASKIGKSEQLREQINYLHLRNYGNKVTKCTLFRDFAPYSFEFLIESFDEKTGQWQREINGGLIYHGQHDSYGSGAAPRYSLTITPVDGWQIHT